MFVPVFFKLWLTTPRVVAKGVQGSRSPSKKESKFKSQINNFFCHFIFTFVGSRIKRFDKHWLLQYACYSLMLYLMSKFNWIPLLQWSSSNVVTGLLVDFCFQCHLTQFLKFISTTNSQVVGCSEFWYWKQRDVVETMNIFCDIYYSNPSIFDKAYDEYCWSDRELYSELSLKVKVTAS